jgi:hypothetical protein
MRKGAPLLLATVAALCLSTSGCGLIFGYGAPQPVTVVTTPEGASLTVDGVPHTEGLSPTTVLLHPKDDHTIAAKLPDGSAGQTHIGKILRTDVVILDGILTLGIGLLVDYLSGSLYMFKPSVQINLGKAPPPRPASPPPSTTTSGGPAPGAAPCAICDEPRGDVTPCPHCGME